MCVYVGYFRLSFICSLKAFVVLLNREFLKSHFVSTEFCHPQTKRKATVIQQSRSGNPKRI